MKSKPALAGEDEILGKTPNSIRSPVGATEPSHKSVVNPSAKTRCLILACGNPLRGDDGAGPHLAAWAEDHFRAQPDVRVLFRQQWTPELAEDLSHADSVLFIDSSVHSAPGEIQLDPVAPVEMESRFGTHHLDAVQLLSLCRHLYGHTPRRAHLLTIGAQHLEFCQGFSEKVREALPRACHAVSQLLESYP